jgi:hypothetical protein
LIELWVLLRAFLLDLGLEVKHLVVGQRKFKHLLKDLASQIQMRYGKDYAI